MHYFKWRNLIVLMGFALAFNAQAQPNNDLVIINEVAPETIDENINPPAPEAVQMPAYVPEAPVIAPPPINNNEWQPEADYSEFENAQTDEPKLVEKPRKKIILQDAGQISEEDGTLWTQEASEDEKIIEQTEHRKRQIDPKKLGNLTQLSKTLGALHALRIACSGEGDQTYRGKMNTMLDLEAPSATYVRDPLILAFNDGFNQTGGGNASCPEDKGKKEAKLAIEGRNLALNMVKYYQESNSRAIK